MGRTATIPAALLAALATLAGAGEARADTGVVVVGPAPERLVEELLWELGPLRRAYSAQDGFDAGAPAVFVMLPDGVNAIRRDGASYFFSFATPDLATTLARFALAPSVLILAPNPGLARVPAAPPRFDWRANRRSLRLDSPWRLRVAFSIVATPRSINGFGAYDDDDLVPYVGFGFRASAQRFLAPRFRVDLTGTYAYVRGDAFTDMDQGHEGGVGAAAMVVGLGRTRWAGGLGLELLIAEELDEAEDTHFGWLGVRVAFIAELGWFTRSGRGLSMQVAPTITRTGYGQVGGGFFTSVGVDLTL